jgi:hypothetical protein
MLDEVTETLLISLPCFLVSDCASGTFKEYRSDSKSLCNMYPLESPFAKRGARRYSTYRSGCSEVLMMLRLTDWKSSLRELA